MDNILILGAGYAGMMTAKHLDKISEPFALITRNSYHYFTTLLHEAAGGRSAPEEYAVPIGDLLHHSTSAWVVDEVVSIDRDNRVVHLQGGQRRYEWLVIGLGWVPDYFGIPGLAEHSLTLTSLDSAVRIRQNIQHEFEAYTQDGETHHLRIAIGGGGLTGIELMGEILDWIPELCLRLEIDKSLVDIQNIEAMPSILPMVSPALREAARTLLEGKGGTLRTNTKVVSVQAGLMNVADHPPIVAGTIIWTGGVRANPLLADCGLTVDRKGRAKVNPYLQSVDDDHIFVGGDSAWFEVNGKPLPPTGQVATQMGPILANNVSSIAHGQAMKPFHAHLQGTLASLGREVGVGDVGGVPVRGLAAGILKEATKVKYLWQLGGLRLAASKGAEVVHL